MKYILFATKTLLKHIILGGKCIKVSPVCDISEMMGHRNCMFTEHYLVSIDTERTFKINQSLMRFGILDDTIQIYNAAFLQ